MPKAEVRDLGLRCQNKCGDFNASYTFVVIKSYWQISQNMVLMLLILAKRGTDARKTRPPPSHHLRGTAPGHNVGAGCHTAGARTEGPTGQR